MRVIPINDESGKIIAAAWLSSAERVHRQLRPHLPAEYTEAMRRVFTDGGRMLVAANGDASAEQAVLGIAVYRVYINTHAGQHLYVDDLVTDEAQRSTGVGKRLMAYMEGVARDAGCTSLTLDSGTQRQQAHKFYFREGMVVTSFHFNKPLTGSKA